MVKDRLTTPPKTYILYASKGVACTGSCVYLAVNTISESGSVMK